jgi:tetratricopeptide (TPR) repeat protein
VNKKIVARNGLVKIAIAEKRYEEAIKLGEELLKLEKPGDEWAPQLYHDMMRALVKLGLREHAEGKRKEALAHLNRAAEYMTKVVRLVNSARNDARNRGDAGKYQELTIVYYRYYHELLVIWKSLRKFKRVNGHIGSLLENQPNFLPADLVAKYERTHREVRKALGLSAPKKTKSGGKSK